MSTSTPKPPPDHVLVVPLGCLGGLVEVFTGQYPLNFSGLPPNPVILDIGANIGAFSIACLQRWPKAVIHAYEPHPEIFYHLARNLEPLKVSCHRAAVGDPLKKHFYPGTDNDLCGSQHDIGRQNTAAPITIDVIPPGRLPKADLAKIDTEGAEWDIISQIPADLLPTVLIVEWHNAANRINIEAHLLHTHGLIYCSVHGPSWGVSVYSARTRGGAA